MLKTTYEILNFTGRFVTHHVTRWPLDMLPPSFTIRVLLREDKANAKGLCPLFLVYTTGGKRKYVSANLRILPEQWVNGKVKGHANSVLYNAQINKLVADTEAKILSGIGLEDKKTAVNTDFFTFAEAIFIAMGAKGQKVTAVRYRNNIPSIQEYHKGNLYLSQIDRAWLKGYEEFCRSSYLNQRLKKKVPVSQNTIWSRFKMLRKILLAAEAEGLIEACPIGEKRSGYPMPKWEKVPKDYLTYDEVLALFVVLDKGGLTEVEEMTLCFFLVECTAGIRHSDWSRFAVEKLKDTNALKVRTKKTGEPVYVPITEGSLLSKAIARIEEKGFKYTATEPALANKLLKVIAKVAGISKPVTTHTGRHTAATLMLERGFSRETVAEVLGVSMKVIDVYAKMTRLKVKSEFLRLGGL